MDKQAKDFEKGWEEHKAKKKQEIETLGQDIADICSDMALNCCGNTPCYACIAKRLERKGYRKITENAVVIPKEISCYDNVEKAIKVYKTDLGSKVEFTNEQILFLTQLYHFDEMRVRKETAEKFAERLKALYVPRLNEWDEISVGGLCFEIDEIAKEITDKGVQNGN